MQKSFQEIAYQYHKKYSFQKPTIKTKIQEDCCMIIVIPCFNEPDLTQVYQSLLGCDFRENATIEIITVINASEKSSSQIRLQNEKTYKNAIHFLEKNLSKKLHFQFIFAEHLPEKHAGVGLARKIGMDEALVRLSQINNNAGIICLDADCQVQKNYLTTLYHTFSDPNVSSASIYFEHRLDNLKETLNAGILNYELFLRYYVTGLRWAGFKSAFHTIGSSMVVRASAYALSGGMNRRKAGEDFYFLHKVALLGGFREINTTTVFPSSRVSDRVPFGTGKAQQLWLNNSDKILFSYNPRIFQDLKLFCTKVHCFYDKTEEEIELMVHQFPSSLQEYLRSIKFTELVSDWNNKSKTQPTFERRFWNNINGLKILKFVHFARDHFYDALPISEACTLFLNDQHSQFSTRKPQIIELLKIFRMMDQEVHEFD